ncbi:winged helix-turn-helix domain-containing protein, partial [Streptomyces sp. NBRC 110611]|uniref:winged helix-turn-helix domain-containing protein n=1 Tax=Streptomyces sp. NBRC 110611 TaxID=1621259 RepID=UPI000B0168F9
LTGTSALGDGTYAGAELFEQEIKPPESRLLRVSRKSAYQWHQVWRDGGVRALVSRGPSGSRCRLSPRCLEKPARYLEQAPAAHGWVEDQVWMAARVATLIGRKFHVAYSVSGATRLMHRLGFSPQAPARRVAERDEQAVAVWKEATWAGVEGPGRPAEATSASRTRQASPAGRPKDAPGAGAAAPRSDGERPMLGTPVRGRPDRHATRLADPAVPPTAHHRPGKGARRSMGERGFIVVALDRLEALVRNRLKRRQYRSATLDGFIAGTGPTLDAPAPPRRAEVSSCS